jgi:hypothetical protein
MNLIPWRKKDEEERDSYPMTLAQLAEHVLVPGQLLQPEPVPDVDRVVGEHLG